MKWHQGSWLKKSAETAFVCALERYELWFGLSKPERNDAPDFTVRRARWRELAAVAWKELTAAREFFIVIDGLANDWRRDANRTRRTVGPASVWYLSDAKCQALWPLELALGPDETPPEGVPMRPFDDCVRRLCTRCLHDGYLIRNQQDLGALWPFSSCIEHRTYHVCLRCRTVTNVTYEPKE
jgi:hypothetical protein